MLLLKSKLSSESRTWLGRLDDGDDKASFWGMPFSLGYGMDDPTIYIIK
jgi:hypothetical protein